jgi:hypothetical protein
MTVYCRLDRSPIRQKPKFYTLLTYFSELCEKTPLWEISLGNFLNFPNYPKEEIIRQHKVELMF